MQNDEYLTGFIAMLNEDYSVAAHHLQNSLAQNRRDPLRRYDLARVLIAKGDFQGAQTQAEVCVQLEPQNDAYRRFQQQVRKALIQQLQGPTQSKFQLEDPGF
ncbi:MAG: tetratricopeptide repeat protein [Planctomycetales bacterium]